MPKDIPVMRPQLAPYPILRPYLERIDDNRYYSNHGPLVREFEARLDSYFGVARGHSATVANGTTALSAALLAVGAKPGSICLVPSWTFVASAAAIWTANLRPRFIDVSFDDWMISPNQILMRSDLHEVGAVMPVSAFGIPLDTQAWDAFSAQTGIPVVIDAAAAFDTLHSIGRASPAKTPMMISFHATKIFGAGEGSAIVSTDAELITRVRQICNFGVWDPTDGQLLGYNGKMSEYHAAIGLATLDGWSARRLEVLRVTRKYCRELSALPEASLSPQFGEGWLSCYCNVHVRGDVPRIIRQLAERGIETRRWWKDGVHKRPAYRDFPRDELPVTEGLAQSVFALPFYHDMSDEAIEYVAKEFRSALTSA